MATLESRIIEINKAKASLRPTLILQLVAEEKIKTRDATEKLFSQNAITAIAAAVSKQVKDKLEAKP